MARTEESRDGILLMVYLLKIRNLLNISICRQPQDQCCMTSFPEPKPPERLSLDEADEDATMYESDVETDIGLDFNRLRGIMPGEPHLMTQVNLNDFVGA